MPSIMHSQPQSLSLFSLQTETYPLDLVSGATAAYSLRKLAVAYSGNGVKVRRSSDNTTLDIPFVGFYLDFTTLSAFVGGNNGFIDTWYDQSGNGRNLVQASLSAQPQIISSGAYITTIGGYPCIDFSGTTYLDYSPQSNLISTTAGTILALWNADTAISTGDGNMIWGNRGGWNGTFIKTISGTPNIRIYGFDGNEDFITVTGFATGTSYLTAWRHAATVLESYIDGGTAVGSVSHGTETTLTAAHVVGRDGQTVAGSSLFDGKISEHIIYNTALSSGDLDTVAASMATPYGKTWS